MGSSVRDRLGTSRYAAALLEQPRTEESFTCRPRTTELAVGVRSLQLLAPAIQKLRWRSRQEDDFTTDPHYFMATNTLRNRRVAAVLIRRDEELEACVYFFEHCRLGVGLGVFRGGDGIGEGLVVGPQELRLHFVHLATQALLGDWRFHGVSLVMLAPIDQCIEVMRPESSSCLFSGRNIQRQLPLADSYRAMLDSMGRRTRRSLATKRQQLETHAQIEFVPWLEPKEAQTAMLQLKKTSRPYRSAGFYRARCELLSESPDCFCMGMRLPTGTWLSVLSGWRRNGVTYVDMQMNDHHYRKESLSAVMRAYLLENEIHAEQHLINFIGGTSLLLRRYCRPVEPCTHAFFWRPCLRASLFERIIPFLQPKNVYQRMRG